MTSAFFYYSGLASAAYATYAGLKYYALTGEGLVSSAKARDMIKNGNVDIVIDVRTKFEWDRGHFKGARHVPVNQLKSEIFIGLPKNTSILVYCNTGQRARAAAETIRNYGFHNVYYIEGGYWTLKNK